MPHGLDVSARTAIQLTRAAPLFDRLVEAVLDHRTSRATTLSGGKDSSGRDSSDFAALRERLDWFFPQFRELYFDLLCEELGPELPLVLGALADEKVQRYLRALEAMRPALLQSMQRLGWEMASALEASSLSACNDSPSHV